MKQRKKIRQLAAVCCLLLLLLVAAGCGKQAKQETLLVAGSSTMLPYMAKLEEGFTKMHPKILIESEGGGSTAGLIAVKRTAIDLATMSREVKRDEDDQYTRDYLVGKDAVAIIVHQANQITGLKEKQLNDIFTGKITNWQQIGGTDAPIAIVSRKAGSTTRKAMDEMVMQGLDFPKSVAIAESAEAVVKTVAANPNAIGYVALKDLSTGVQALHINNIPVSKETILSGRYPLSRSFYLVIYDKPKTAVQKFVDYVMSNEGQTILEREGLIRVY